MKDIRADSGRLGFGTVCRWLANARAPRSIEEYYRRDVDNSTRIARPAETRVPKESLIQGHPGLDQTRAMKMRFPWPFIFSDL
jgi:hypothetical protein